MASTSPCSLAGMLRKSLTTFQGREHADEGAVPRTPSPAPSGTPLFRLSPEESRRCLRLLELLGDPSDSGPRLLDAALAVDAAGRREAALLLYRLSLTLAPSATAFNNLAVLHAEGEEPDAEERALEWLEKGLERFPGDATLLENYALFREE